MFLEKYQMTFYTCNSYMNYLLLKMGIIHIFARRADSSRHMCMFSRHRKLDFCKIISFISGLKCIQNYDNL